MPKESRKLEGKIIKPSYHYPKIKRQSVLLPVINTETGEREELDLSDTSVAKKFRKSLKEQPGEFD